MGFSKDKFTLFFSLKMDSLDFANLDASGVKQVMVTLGAAVAFPDMLTELAKRVVKLIIRCEEESYYDDNAPTRTLVSLNRIKQIIPIAAVIVGCEPENPLNFQYGSPDWAGHVWEHRRRFDTMRLILQNGGYKVVSPGWTSRAISEDDKPQPGSTTWDEITRPVYNACDGNAGHIYEYGWDGPIDTVRFKTTLREMQRVRHKPIYLDEIGVSGRGAIERMRAYIEIGQLLLTHPLGQRVEMLCPFISGGNPGDPPVWPIGFLIREPQAYVELGQWIST